MSKMGFQRGLTDRELLALVTDRTFMFTRETNRRGKQQNDEHAKSFHSNHPLYYSETCELVVSVVFGLRSTFMPNSWHDAGSFR